MHTANALTAAMRVREDALENALEAYQDAMHTRVEAELDYERARAEAGLLCDERNELRRRAWVMTECEIEFRAFKIAEGLEEAAKAAYFVAQTKAQNGASLIALHRTEMTLAGSPVRT